MFGGMLQDSQKDIQIEIFLIKLSQFHQAFRLQNLNRAGSTVSSRARGAVVVKSIQYKNKNRKQKGNVIIILMEFVSDII